MCVITHCNASVVHFFGIWITVLTERAPLQTRGITHEWAKFSKGGTDTAVSVPPLLNFAVEIMISTAWIPMQCPESLTISAHHTTNEYNCLFPAS